MFSLDLNSFFPGIERAKALARLLNGVRRRDGIEADPREIQRMRDELRLARERVRLEVSRARMIW